MTSNNNKHISDYLDNVQTDRNNKMSVDTHINMNSKLIDNSIAEVCDKMDLRIVRELSLCFNDVFCIPNNFSQHLTDLQRLDLSNNNLQELPSSFSLLTKLEHLKMDHNKLKIIPTVLAEIRCLKFLSVSHNQIEEISEDLGSLVHLEVFNLSFNNLSKFPNSFVRLNRLRDLNLSGNIFEILPECIADGMRNIEILDVSLNKNIKLNVPPCSKRLIKFYASKNGVCRTFPRWLLTSAYSTLEEVDFNETEFLKFSFPKEKTTLNLRIFSFKQSILTDNIVEMLTKDMKRLEKINIGNDKPSEKGNIFCKMPFQKLSNPHRVKEIYMNGTGLPMVSRLIKDLTNITIIDFSHNTISWLPDEFCLLINLEVLIINNNNMTALPDNFGNLVELKELIMNCNQLSSLPVSMSNLKELRFLDLYDNELLEMPWNVVNLKHLQALDIDVNFFPTENLIIRNMSYEILRKPVREKCVSFSERVNGAKPPEQENEYSASVSSASSPKSELYYESDENPTDSAFLCIEEENWELSEDSTDEYEPSFVRRKKYNSSALPPSFHSHYFCPDDLHALSIKQQVRQMYNDKRQHISTFEEGQFDDA